MESYVKEGVTKTYTKTTSVDKNKSVCDIYANLVARGVRYLYHRSIADNIKAVLPKIFEKVLQVNILKYTFLRTMH